eukprot:scaffold46958_cov27-Tisochrysis_lutea.AAC.1
MGTCSGGIVLSPLALVRLSFNSQFAMSVAFRRERGMGGGLDCHGIVLGGGAYVPVGTVPEGGAIPETAPRKKRKKRQKLSGRRTREIGAVF